MKEYNGYRSLGRIRFSRSGDLKRGLDALSQMNHWQMRELYARYATGKAPLDHIITVLGHAGDAEAMTQGL